MTERMVEKEPADMPGPGQFRERRAQLNAAARLLFAKQVLAWLAIMCAAIIAAFSCFPAFRRTRRWQRRLTRCELARCHCCR